MPLDIELSSTLPAAQPFYLEFEWASMVNKSVTATTTLLIEAEQRHEWTLLSSMDHNKMFNQTVTTS